MPSTSSLILSPLEQSLIRFVLATHQPWDDRAKYAGLDGASHLTRKAVTTLVRNSHLLQADPSDINTLSKKLTEKYRKEFPLPTSATSRAANTADLLLKLGKKS